MHPIDTKLRKLIYRWLDESEFGYDKVNINIFDKGDEFHSKSFGVYTKKDFDNLLNYYAMGDPYYVYRGQYPLVYMNPSEDLKFFVSFFSSKHVPVIVDYYSEKMGENLFYKTLIWGDGSLLMDKSIINGVHGKF